ncbi:protein adenylyltransferase SelO [Alkalicoccus chagannorensis]|uniref:protein adenylyltransferase SelO n=1 Tax=Alkalicoccus chagannorensis TaxID=427072 RepID=UPI00047DBBEA|nr:YdiU family protein [Alkalicoccus chagannorensis]
MTQSSTAGWQLKQTYAYLHETFFVPAEPAPAEAPKLLLFNRGLADSLGLDADEAEAEAAQTLSGTTLPEQAYPISQAYAGHQFGHFTMLGDGRAHLLGEQQCPDGRLMDIQLKGSGRTPFSRGGDGRAALGPMLREYIISEAMHALGIPTNRSLAVVATGETVRRQRMEPGAVLTRAASSYLRAGTFQYAAQFGSTELVQQLADYAINRHDPEAAEADNPYLAFFRRVMERQASLTASWQGVGFIHGVMNTDNMFISGETMDYGPCAFMNAYDPATFFSSIDQGGRYAYENQPKIAGWNLARLAESMLPLFDEDEEKALAAAQEELYRYTELYHEAWLDVMRAKIGLAGQEEDDEPLIDQLLSMMQAAEADWTNTFAGLTEENWEKANVLQTPAFQTWYTKVKARRERQDEPAFPIMKRANPAVIPRNHRVEEALAAAESGDMEPLHALMAVLSSPFDYEQTPASYQEPPPPSSLPYRTFCGT